MNIERYRASGSIADLIDEVFDYPYRSSFTIKGRFVNEDDYEIRPKKHFIERQIKEKEQRLEELRQRKKNEQKWYEEQEKSIMLEIDTLKQKLSP